jgi:hypothetical protein
VSPANPSLTVSAVQPFIATGTFSDNSTQTLASTSWSSSDNTIATITNDLSDPGQVYAVALGSATISACTGSVCGSTTVTVAPPPPSVTSISPASGTIGTAVTLTGANFGATQGSSTVTFNGVAAPVTNWTASSIGVSVPAGTTTGNLTVNVTVSGVASNGRSFTLLPSLASMAVQPSIPGMLVGGTQQFTATGTYTDGSTQNITTLVNWTSNNSGVATISASGLATGIASGNAIISASLGSASSSVTLTVAATATAPAISAQASPPPNANGWNNSNVTVTFTCTVGSSTIASCPAPQTISTEAANQVISGTATDVNGLTAAASVTLNIDKTIPVLAVTSPTDGSAFTTSSVSISGTVSDALSGVSSMTCDGVATTVSGGAFSCNISLNIGVNLVVVRATDSADNVAGSNFHLSLSGTLTAPQSLQITPATVNMLVGDTQTFTVVDELGRPRTDAMWTISDTTLATISTDSSPILTAVAVGQATLTANVQGATAQAQVNILGGSSLAPGTVRWSAPPIPGFTCKSIIQAVPTNAGTPDLYCIALDSNNSALIQAFTADGRQMWQYSLSMGPGQSLSAVPDSFGGLLVTNAGYTPSTFDLDGQTGQPAWQVSSFALGDTAIGQDGTVYNVASCAGQPLALVGLDGTTGTQRLCLPLPPAPTSLDPAPTVGPLTVNSDGSIDFGLESFDDSNFLGVVNGLPTYEVKDTLSLYQVLPNGTTSVQVLNTSDVTIPILSGFCVGFLRASPQGVIPDGQGGLVALWGQPLHACSFTPVPVTITHVSASGTNQFNLPFSTPAISMVLGENGTAFATDGSTVLSFDVNSGSVNWSYQASTQTRLSIIASAAGNGLVAKTTTQAIDTVARFDSTGALTQDGWTGTSLQFLLGDMWLSPASSNGPLSAILATTFDWAFSIWPRQNSNGTYQAKKKIKVLVYTVSGAGVSTQYIHDKVTSGINLWQTKGNILFDWDGTIQQPLLAGCDPNNPPPGNTCVSGGAFDITNVTLLSQLSEVLRRLSPPPSRGVELLFVNQLGPNNTADGYTPPEYKNPSGVTNLSIFQNNSSISVLVAHELGHVLGLPHINNPINLMCGPTDNPWLSSVTPCWSTITRLLKDDQINKARKTATLLVEP